MEKTAKTSFALALTTLLFLLTACRQEQLSLPITEAAAAQPPGSGQNSTSLEIPDPPQQPLPDMQRMADDIDQRAPAKTCYSFILLRPRSQRATAVQARLKQADRMAAAFDSHLITVDIVGDHANVLSLQFPVAWPVDPSYSDRLSSIVEDYFASSDIEDYMCNSGFAAVKLSARGLNDRRIHPVWTARVTSEGLLRDASDSDQVADSEPLSIR